MWSMANPFAAQLADALENSWPAIARPNQLPPPGDWWQIWLLLAGRGFGKTRTLAEWVCQQTRRTGLRAVRTGQGPPHRQLPPFGGPDVRLHDGFRSGSGRLLARPCRCFGVGADRPARRAHEK